MLCHILATLLLIAVASPAQVIAADFSCYPSPGQVGNCSSHIYDFCRTLPDYLPPSKDNRKCYPQTSAYKCSLNALNNGNTPVAGNKANCVEALKLLGDCARGGTYNYKGVQYALTPQPGSYC